MGIIDLLIVNLKGMNFLKSLLPRVLAEKSKKSETWGK